MANTTTLYYVFLSIYRTIIMVTPRCASISKSDTHPSPPQQPLARCRRPIASPFIRSVRPVATPSLSLSFHSLPQSHQSAPTK